MSIMQLHIRTHELWEHAQNLCKAQAKLSHNEEKKWAQTTMASQGVSDDWQLLAQRESVFFKSEAPSKLCSSVKPYIQGYMRIPNWTWGIKEN